MIIDDVSPNMNPPCFFAEHPFIFGIRIIRHSFAMLNRSEVIGLLAHAKQCQRLFVQNRPGETERICSMLPVEHPELGIPPVPYSCEF